MTVETAVCVPMARRAKRLEVFYMLGNFIPCTDSATLDWSKGRS